MACCQSCGHDQALADSLIGDAFKNEQHWIDIALQAAEILEVAGLALPEGELRERCLSAHTAIRTTPMLNAKKGPGTRNYRALKAGRAYELAYPLN